MSSAPIAPARTVALEVIRAVREHDAYANLALAHEIARHTLSTQDAALATELTAGTLRTLGTLDAVIASAAGREVNEIDPLVLDILRLATHQLLSLRIPAHAAVNDAVSQTRAEVGERAVGFVNAVLRRIAARDAEAWHEIIVADARSDDERLALETSHPVWIIRALRRALANEGRVAELRALLAADNRAPGVSMLALPGLALVPESALTTCAPFSPVGFSLERGSPEPLVRRSGGRLRVQDEGSQLVTLALSRLEPVREGEQWLDLCAGPGGKTALLAADALRSGAHLVANEVAPHRAELVRRALAPFGDAVPVAEHDGRDFSREHPEVFDRILIDAPCTGLGALRRRPESRWRKMRADVAELHDLQVELLAGAARSLAPGGVAAYVTCSPHPNETHAVVDRVLADAHDLEELDAVAAISAVSRAPIDLARTEDAPLRAQLWPHRHGTDAMFLALLRRREATIMGDL